jgi:hypothetical protein
MLFAPYYDTIGKTCATLQQLLYHRTITLSLTNNLWERDRPMKKKLSRGGPCFTNCVILQDGHLYLLND